MDNLMEHRKRLEQDGVILYFRGPVTQSVVEGIGEMMRRKLGCDDFARSVSLDVFAVIVEQLQNIINYSSERRACPDDGHEHMGFGELVIGKRDEGFYVICGNKVDKELAPRIEEKLTALRDMSKEDLKRVHKQARHGEPDELSRGAGLGFIEMARRARQPLDYQFSPSEDGSSSYFSLKVFI